MKSPSLNFKFLRKHFYCRKPDGVKQKAKYLTTECFTFCYSTNIKTSFLLRILRFSLANFLTLATQSIMIYTIYFILHRIYLVDVENDYD